MATDRGRGAAVGPQLTLNVRLRDEATLDNFLCLPGLEPLLASMRAIAAGDSEPSLLLHGPADSGRTHLLQAACHASKGSALYLPLHEMKTYPAAEVLQDTQSLALVAIDDLQAIAGDRDWEIALFNLFNEALAGGCRLVFAADGAPSTLGVALADLRSRLEWGAVFRLPSLSDEEKRAIFEFRATRRGLRLGTETVDYLFRRAPRDLASLMQLLETLDRASLTEQRALSVPFVRDALGW